MTPTHAQLDRLLEALRATGRDAYRADPDQVGAYHAYCPACASRMTGGRRLRIVEGSNGRVRITCSLGCTAEAITNALRVTELYPNAWVRECADTAAVADRALEQLLAERQTVVALRREAS